MLLYCFADSSLGLCIAAAALILVELDYELLCGEVLSTVDFKRRQEGREREQGKNRIEISLCPFQLTGNRMKVVPRHDIASINSGSNTLHMANDPLYGFISFGFNSLVLSIRMMDLS